MRLLVPLVAVPLLLLAAGNPAAAQAIRAGERIPFAADSPHPYPAGAGSEPVWTVTIDHPGATFLSIHFDRFDLARGDRVVIRSEDGLQQHVFTGRGRADMGKFWAYHVKGDRAIVELFATGHGKEAYGVTIDEYSAGLVDLDTGAYGESTEAIETVCSGDDRLPAICYETSEPEIYDRSRPVARLLVEGTLLCTGWLVGCNGDLMTNNHCIDDPSLPSYPDWFASAANTDYEFMAQAPTCAGGCGGQLCFPGTIWSGAATLVKRHQNLDYAFIHLAGDPQDTFGSLLLDDREPVANERIYIPQHGGGRDKKIAVTSQAAQDQSGYCEIWSQVTPCTGGTAPDIGYFCDSEGGSSGSPVLAYDTHQVIALHHCGGCANTGVRITQVINNLGALLPACALGGDPVLQYAGHSIDDSIGNNNGIADPFEILTIPVELANVGTGRASGISATLTTTTSGVTILDDTATWPDITSLFQRETDPPHFQVQLADTIPCGTVIDFDLDVVTDQGLFPTSFQQVVGQGGVQQGTYAALDVPKAVPDNSAGGVTSAIFVPDSYSIGDITVTVNISHTRIGDLIVELTSPSATTVRLHNQTGGQADDIVTTFDVPTAPDGPGTMSDFDGEPINGFWTLKVADVVNNQTGTLNSWSIHASEGGSPVCSPVPCKVAADAQAIPEAVCDGEMTTLVASATEFGQDCSGVFEYRFELGGQVLQDWSTDLDAIVTPPASTVYTVRARDQGTLAEGTAFPAVTLNAAPSPTVVQTPTTQCVEIAAVTLDGGPGYTSYTWKDATTGAVLGTSQTLNANCTLNPTVTLDVTSAGACDGSMTYPIDCVVCTPTEVSAPGNPVPMKVLNSSGLIEFELLPEPVKYHAYVATSMAGMLSGDYAYKFCDLQNNTAGTFVQVDSTTARFLPIVPQLFVEGSWIIMAESQGFEGSYGADSDGTPRPHDLDGVGSVASVGCP